MKKFLCAALYIGLTIFAAAPATGAETRTWPQFRGPDGQGHSTAVNLPLTWSTQENLAWNTPLPGRAWSSPVIADGNIWLTTAIDFPASKEEKEKRLASNSGNQPLSVSNQIVLRALCVDLRSGRLLQNIQLMKKTSPQPTHSLNSYASPTPVLENGRLYCHFGAYGTCCLDTKTGRVLWTNQKLVVQHENGPGSTAIIHGDLMIFHCDGSDEQYIVALDKRTGEVVWKTNRSGQMNDNPQLQKAYGTPLVVLHNGREVLISPAADWLYGYDPASGEELWKLNYGVLGFSIVPRPVAKGDMIYFSTSFMKPQILAVRLGLKTSDQPRIVWRFKKQAPRMPSPLLVGDSLYILSEKGIVTCLNTETGEPRWTKRLGGNYAASPLYGDGKIYFFSEEGVGAVIAPAHKYTELAVNKLDERFMASPAAIDGALILRTEKGICRVNGEGR